MSISGTSGNDNLVGTSGNDTFNLRQGGDDTAQGLDGNDVFVFGGTFTAADTVDGGTGNDLVRLDGDYSGANAVTLDAATIANVETIQLTAGNSYSLTTNDANVASGKTLYINGTALLAGNDLIFDGSAETDGNFRITAGLGDDTVTLGAALTTADRITGGGGNDVVNLDGTYNLTLGRTTLRGIGDLVLAGGHNYHLVTNDGTVDAAATMNVNASDLGAGDTLDFNATHELDGNFNFTAGTGLTEIAAGRGSDVFFMGANLTAADRLNGGEGTDVMYLAGNYDLTLAKSTLVSIDNLHLAGGFNYQITSAGRIDTNATMVVDATSLTASDTLNLDFSKELNGSVIIDATGAAATLKGGQQGDAFDFSDTSQGGLVASDTIDGQGGYDRLYFDGDYTGAHALVLTDSTVVNVEEFDFEPGHSYNITLAPHTIENSETLAVDASLLGAGDSLTFDGSTLQPVGLTTDDSLQFTGGAGNDTLIGCYGHNSYDLTKGGEDTASGTAFGSYNYFIMGAAFDAGDRLTGSAGVSSNYVDLNGDYTGANAVTLGDTTLSGITQMNFEHGHNYDITWADGDLAAGGIFTVDAQPLQANEHARFNGRAEKDGQFVFLSGNGADDFTGGSKGDTFRYDTGIVLSAATHDIIHRFDARSDVIAYNNDGNAGANAPINSGTVNAATIDADLATILTASNLAANHYVLLTPDAGDQAGHLFLVLDGNGTAGYQKGWDLVIELQDSVNLNFTAANFHN